MGPNEFQAKSGVSRETLDRLAVYADLLVKWQARINLVGADTLADLWSRHFLDSAQLFSLIPPTAKRLADLGSGAGFPGLVLAIMRAPDVHLPEIYLIESDSRKCAFLREAARVTGTPVTVINKRIEQVAPLAADVVTARALAPLVKLLDWAAPHLAIGGQCLFLKGRGAEDELTATAKEWNIAVDRTPSLTDPAGFVLQLREVCRGRAQR